MELLGGEFGDMTPQELAAPVNTVTVSSKEIKTHSLHHAHGGYTVATSDKKHKQR